MLMWSKKMKNKSGTARCVKNILPRSLKECLKYLGCFTLVCYLYFTFGGKKVSSTEEQNNKVDAKAISNGLMVDKPKMQPVASDNFHKMHTAPSSIKSVVKGTMVRSAADRGKVYVERVSSGHPACKQSWKTDWSAIESAGKPLIELDPNRFIYPLLINGPNNQLIGLRDSMYLAIRLNRTLIMPAFYKHKTDSSVHDDSDSFIPASQRVDVASIAALMSIKPFRTLKSICASGFDSLLFTSYSASRASLRRVVEDIGLPARTKDTGEEAQIYPENMETSFQSSEIRSDKESLLNLYDSPGICALYALPFRTVGTKENPQSLRKVYDKYFTEGNLRSDTILPDKVPDEDLYALVAHSTPKPKHIIEIVDDFVSNYQLKTLPYLSVHWRYDVNDWQRRCKTDKLQKKEKEHVIQMCDRVKNIAPADLATAIIKQIYKFQRKYMIPIKAVYIAAPLNMEEFIVGTKSALQQRIEGDGIAEDVVVFTQEDLHDHLLNYSSCEGLKESYEDIFSQLEMVVCSRATVFFRSPSSSWSKVICEMRSTKSITKYDDNIYELAWQAARARLAT